VCNAFPVWLSLLPSDRHSLTRNYLRYLKRFTSANELDLEERYRGYSQIFDPGQLNALGIPPALEDDALAAAFAEARGEEPFASCWRPISRLNMPERSTAADGQDDDGHVSRM
jgi:hypothetical protein